MDSPMNTAAHTPKSFFSNVWSHLRSRETVFIALVFVLAFAVRAALMRFELLFEFDTYFHARMASYVIQGLPVPTVDPLGYYQTASSAIIPDPPWLFWDISAALYKIFTLNSAYNLERWIFVLKILPALYGALTCVAMYYLGKALFHGNEARAKYAGLFAGLFAAVVPSFVYRTMGGFFEPDAMGFLWMVIGFVFFARAIRHPEWKRENIVNALLAAAAFILMVFTWQGFNLLVLFILGIGVVQFLLLLSESDWVRAKHYAQLWFVAVIPLAIAATIHTSHFWLDQLVGPITSALFHLSEIGWQYSLTLLLLLFAGLGALWKFGKEGKIEGRILKGIYTAIVLFLFLIPLLVVMFNISLQTGDQLGQTVGEESPGHNYFGNKYSMMFLYLVVGLPTITYMLARKGKDHAYLVFPLVWIVITFFLAWGKLKYTYYMGLPLALLGAVVFVFAIDWLKGRSIVNQKLIAVVLGFFILASTGAGILFVQQNVPNIETTPEWKTALFWAADNLPADAKIFNWWDEGHWISFFTGRKTLIDNRNADPPSTAKVAEFVSTSDLSRAWHIVDNFGSTHLIFGDDILQKVPSMVYFAYNITSNSDPRLAGLFGAVLPCSQSITPVTHEVSYTCGPNTLTQDQMSTYPTTWQAKPNSLQSGVPLYIYRASNNQKLYAFTEKTNNTMIVRLWFGETTAMQAFTPIYANSGVMIFQKNPLPAGIDSIVDENASTDVNASAPPA